jgi:aryl-alcohol dehydrogenase (NADP+)
VYREEEREMIPLCLDQGIGVIPWSPLARGFLAGNRTQDKSGETTRARSDDFAHHMYYSEADFAVLNEVQKLGDARGVKPAQIALAWMLHRPGITAPIVGASKMYQLDEAIAACDIALNDEEIKALEEPYIPHRILGHG